MHSPQRATCAGFLLLALLAPNIAAQQKAPARDWQKHPAIVRLDTASDIYALGDVHGDYERLVALLVSAKIIAQDPGTPEKAQWQAGQAVLICTGDIIDKGNKSLEVIAFFRALQSSAARQGGRVIVTMGNHEATFLAGPTNKKAEKFIEELEARKMDPKTVAAGRDAEGVGQFLGAMPLAARINDWFFAHAGFTRGRSLQQLDSELRDDIDARGYDPFLSASLNALLEARLHEIPWWEKANEDASASRQRLQGFAKALGVNHIVIGHQPGKAKFADKSVRKKGEMFQLYDGLLFLIDVGMSRGIDKSAGQGYSEGAILHIRGGSRASATAIFPRNPPRQLWASK